MAIFIYEVLQLNKVLLLDGDCHIGLRSPCNDRGVTNITKLDDARM